MRDIPHQNIQFFWKLTPPNLDFFGISTLNSTYENMKNPKISLHKSKRFPRYDCLKLQPIFHQVREIRHFEFRFLVIKSVFQDNTLKICTWPFSRVEISKIMKINTIFHCICLKIDFNIFLHPARIGQKKWVCGRATDFIIGICFWGCIGLLRNMKSFMLFVDYWRYQVSKFLFVICFL